MGEVLQKSCEGRNAMTPTRFAEIRKLLIEPKPSIWTPEQAQTRIVKLEKALNETADFIILHKLTDDFMPDKQAELFQEVAA
ncbi:hypothetical protein [Bacteriophage sp.]|nr:hypothetical protein [Bacteriophage sp.]